MTNEKSCSYCNVCDQENWHDIKGNHSYRNYDDAFHYAVIQCRGCVFTNCFNAFIIDQYLDIILNDLPKWKEKHSF